MNVVKLSRSKLVLIVTAAVMTIGALVYIAVCMAEAPLPNLIIIQTDATRADHLGCYGYAKAQTPNIDALARQGILFEQTIANSPYTASSVPSLMTGNYQNKHGLIYQGDTLTPSNITLAERLREAGYRTAAFVANGLLAPGTGYAQGFEEYSVPSPRGWLAVETADKVIQWLQGNSQRPFFLHVFFLDPHFPYLPPEPYDRILPEQGDVSTSLSFRFSKEEIDIEDILWGRAVKEENIRQEVALYDGEISYSDHHVGRILDELDNLGLRENTIVVFSSDHGENLGEHSPFHFDHGRTTYDSVLRVPLIFRLPHMSASGTRIHQVVRVVDIVPTILDVLGLPGRESVDGRSLSPVLNGSALELPPVAAYAESAPIHEGFYKETPRMYLEGREGVWRTIRNENWKLIRIPRPEGPEYELYNIERDPNESANIYATEMEEAELLKAALEELESRMFVSGSDRMPALDERTMKTLGALGYVGTARK